VADADMLAVLPEIEGIEDAGLRSGVVATWTTVWETSGLGPRLVEVPFAIAAPGEPLIAHIRAVAAAAEALADLVERRGQPPVDRDLLRAACMLHDVDKPLMLQPAGGGWRATAAARRIGHGTLGAMLCREHGLPEPVVHLVQTHTAASKIAPEPFEGVLLHYADFFAADTALFDAGSALLMHR
jgi:putative nucleotidyltransferase with HDIG domain